LDKPFTGEADSGIIETSFHKDTATRVELSSVALLGANAISLDNEFRFDYDLEIKQFIII